MIRKHSAKKTNMLVILATQEQRPSFADFLPRVKDVFSLRLSEP